ncbi:hypothetical protein PRUB_a5233 [Pseudoalteromonas rubra]|uniref:Uncharacterized protein n=1 Tax=Pseudoalteromonas rubra TaxID=43658 RepID=A0A8T0C4D5_9GAMM|nr:hypothetical protein PRUB_a5233 [Pseudoalteromonas rubra]
MVPIRLPPLFYFYTLSSHLHKAISKNGSEFQQRTLKVREAKQKQASLITNDQG